MRLSPPLLVRLSPPLLVRSSLLLLVRSSSLLWLCLPLSCRCRGWSAFRGGGIMGGGGLTWIPLRPFLAFRAPRTLPPFSSWAFGPAYAVFRAFVMLEGSRMPVTWRLRWVGFAVGFVGVRSSVTWQPGPVC